VASAQVPLGHINKSLTSTFVCALSCLSAKLQVSAVGFTSLSDTRTSHNALASSDRVSSRGTPNADTPATCRSMNLTAPAWPADLGREEGRRGVPLSRTADDGAHSVEHVSPVESYTPSTAYRYGRPTVMIVRVGVLDMADPHH